MIQLAVPLAVPPWFGTLCIQASVHGACGSPSDPLKTALTYLQLAEMNEIDALNIDPTDSFININLHFHICSGNPWNPHIRPMKSMVVYVNQHQAAHRSSTWNSTCRSSPVWCKPACWTRDLADPVVTVVGLIPRFSWRVAVRGGCIICIPFGWAMSITYTFGCKKYHGTQHWRIPWSSFLNCIQCLQWCLQVFERGLKRTNPIFSEIPSGELT